MKFLTKLTFLAAGLATGIAFADATPLGSPTMLEDGEIRAAIVDATVSYRTATERFCAGGEWYANGESVSRGRYVVTDDDQVCVTEFTAAEASPICRRLYRSNSHYYITAAGPGGPNGPPLQPVRIRPLTPPADCR
ncbi:MAG: hypothetical protein JNJ73_09150 [Hyphomonadaceae bacterium]|nr:hypothetical protein [Hyphomonadaceae bacterium]